MNKNEFKQVIKDQFGRISSLTASKGEEYANSPDQLANFKRQSAQLGISPQLVLSVYLNKHLDAIMSYVQSGAVLSEPISGRIDDAILYLILLQAMVHEATESTPEALEEEVGTLAPSEDFPIHGWSVLEDDERVTLMVAGRYFLLAEVSKSEAGRYLAQQLRYAMIRLTGQEERPK